MWSTKSEFNFDESRPAGGQQKEFEFVGQEPTGGGPAMIGMQAEPEHYPMAPPQQAPYAQQGMMPPGMGMGYPGMGMPPMGQGMAPAPTFTTRLVQGAIVGGVLAGALSYFLRKGKKR